MNRSFYNHTHTGLRRMLCVILSILLLTSIIAGCSKKPEDTVPSTDSMLDLGNETTPSTDTTPSTEAPSDPTSETINPEILNIRNTPGMDGSVIGHLEPGTKIDVLREETEGGLRWALIRQGWICIEYLEQYMNADGVLLGDDSETTATTAPTETTAATKPVETTAPTTGGNTGNTGNTGTNTGTGTTTNTPGVVIATELNIRKDADINSDGVGQYKYGDRITILETKNGWGRTDKGWVYMDYVYKDGTTGKNSCKGVVTVNGLNIRSGPGTKYDGVGSLNTGARVNVLERIQIGDSWWGCIDKGWISMDYVYVDGTEGDGAGYGTVTGDAVNVRSGPGTGFDRVGSLNSGDDVDILFQIEIGDTAWGCIGVGKWICMDYVGMG